MRKSRYTEEQKLLINSLEYNYTCTKCKIEKKNIEFHNKVREGSIRMYNTVCKACQSEYSKSVEKISKEKRREQKLKYNFNISMDRYNEMLVNQNFECKICLIDQSKLNRNFDVDHNHNNDEIRGLLCHNCNVAIGLLKENVIVIKRAISYLEEFNIPMNYK